MRRARFLVVVWMSLVMGCGESDPSPTHNLDGTWLITFTDMEINGVETCTLGPLDVVLNQTGSTLSGTHEATTLDCSVSGVVVQTAGVVSSGLVGPTAVTIRMDEAARTRTFTGTFDSETAMSGLVTWTHEDGVQLVSGSWSAAKE